jgi:hypothetical protein
MTNVFFSRVRIAAIPVLLGLIALFEARHFVTYFRLFTFIAVLLLSADITSLVRGRWRDFMVVATSLALGLCIMEGAADILSPDSVARATPGLSVGQPLIGWGPKHPGRFSAKRIDPRTGKTIFDVNYTIDSNLLRQTQSCEKGPTIAFFGCSFTFGEGLNDADTLPQVLSDDFDHKLRVINLGFTGYGPQQFLRELETGRFDAIIGGQPKLFIFLTSSFHAERTACKAYWTGRAPLYTLENGKIVFKGACNEGPSLWLREFLHNTAIYRLFVEPHLSRINHDDVDLYIRISLAAVNLAKEKYHVPTLVPYLRQPEAYLRGTGFTDDEIMQRLQDGGAIVIDASLATEQANGVQISIPGDGHPTPSANRLRAALLKSYIEQHMSDASSSGIKLINQNSRD